MCVHACVLNYQGNWLQCKLLLISVVCVVLGSVRQQHGGSPSVWIVCLV